MRNLLRCVLLIIPAGRSPTQSGEANLQGILELYIVSQNCWVCLPFN